MSKIQEAIETMNIMESSYSHIRKSDKEFEAIEAGKSALQEQAEREKGCEYCKGLVHGGNADGSTLKELEARARITQGNFCPVCGRDLRKPVQK